MIWSVIRAFHKHAVFAALAATVAAFECKASDSFDCSIAMAAEADKHYDFLRQQVEKGDHCAELSLARIYLEGDEILERNPEKALEFAQRAVISGLPVAQYELALMYMGGQGINADYDEVIHWLALAAKQNYVPAQTSLGRLLIEGRLVKRDLRQGFRLLLEAEKSGGVVAKQLLIEMADSLEKARPSSKDQN